jgi:hypothetical protein
MEHHLQVGLLACRPDDLTYPTDHADERAAKAKFLTALPRHEPGWLLLTEGVKKRTRRGAVHHLISFT